MVIDMDEKDEVASARKIAEGLFKPGRLSTPAGTDASSPPRPKGETRTIQAGKTGKSVTVTTVRKRGPFKPPGQE